MTHDELREKVAAIIRRGAIYPVTSEELADAAIALVLEEAARVAEGTINPDAIHMANMRAQNIAAAIRALIPKAPEGPNNG